MRLGELGIITPRGGRWGSYGRTGSWNLRNFELRMRLYWYGLSLVDPSSYLVAGFILHLAVNVLPG